MITFNKIKIRNFMSCGNRVQEVNLNSSPLSVVLGQNKDTANDDAGNSSRNGVGKTTVVQAIHWCLFGKSIENKIRVANLVNKTNKKDCVVILEFTINGTDYVIKRKMKPNQLHFQIDTPAGLIDVAQGENKDTQEEINNILNLTPQLFCQIITLTSYVRPFLEETPAKQRDIMEELLGVTQLSEKASKLKDMNKEVKIGITMEEKQLETLKSSNSKIESTISKLEETEHNFYISIQTQQATQQELIQKYINVDFDSEFSSHERNRTIEESNRQREIRLSDYNKLKLLSETFEADNNSRISEINETIESFNYINFDEEKKNHELLQDYNIKFSEYQQSIQNHQSWEREYNRLEKELLSVETSRNQTKIKMDSIEPESCPTCGSDINHETHSAIIGEYQTIINDYSNKISEITISIEDLSDKPIILDVPVKPDTIFSTIQEVFEAENILLNLGEELKRINSNENPYLEQVNALKVELENETTETLLPVHFETLQEANIAFNDYNNAVLKFNELSETINPYTSQIESMKDTLNPIDYEELNRLKTMQEHQTFLLKLLTSKDSFVRKRIIDQNINYLNTRLEHYLSKTGLQHKVKFQNDLTVNITHLGLLYDFGNLSRGEKTRCILALSLSFRDTFEALHQSINFMMIDELLDLGIDTAGVLQCFKMMNDFAHSRGKNLFLVSHREEILEKQVDIIHVVKENGFTHITQDQ